MRHIRIQYLDVKYPLGSNIPVLRAVTAEYVNGFEQISLEDGTNINLWCRGSSGAILATAFALALPKYNFKIIHVKKRNESAHYPHADPFSNGIHVVIDDFISSGDTIRAILEKIPCRAYALIVINGVEKEMSSNFDVVICSGTSP